MYSVTLSQGKCNVSRVIQGEACSPHSCSVGYNLRNGKTVDLKDNSSITKENRTLKKMRGKTKKSCLFFSVAHFFFSELEHFIHDKCPPASPFGGDCFPKVANSTTGLHVGSDSSREGNGWRKRKEVTESPVSNRTLESPMPSIRGAGWGGCHCLFG